MEAVNEVVARVFAVGVGIARAPEYWNVDMSLSKRINTLAGQYFMFRIEAFNLLNHPNFGPPDRNIQSQTFGTITSTAGGARIVGKHGPAQAGYGLVRGRFVRAVRG